MKSRRDPGLPVRAARKGYHKPTLVKMAVLSAIAAGAPVSGGNVSLL